MATVLVVANRTLVGEALLGRIRDRCTDGPCRFHLLVPVVHPAGHVWTEGEVNAAAQERLDEAMARFRSAGADVTGEIADANPVAAVTTWLQEHAADEIIVSTLPPGPSRWLKWDVVNRITRAVPVPVTHVVYSTERATA